MMGQLTQQEMTSHYDGGKCVCLLYACTVCKCVCSGLYMLHELEVHVQGRMTSE